jgi:hypothetical protein
MKNNSINKWTIISYNLELHSLNSSCSIIPSIKCISYKLIAMHINRCSSNENPMDNNKLEFKITFTEFKL